MYRFCVVLAALGLATTASAATVDVDNLLLGPFGTGVSGLGALSATVIPGSPRTNFAIQTWTVGLSGILAQVDLFGGVGSAYSTDGVIYDGGGPSDFEFDVTLTILGGGTVFQPGTEVLGAVTRRASDIVNFGVTSFDVSALDIYATAGTVLTWRMSVEACPTTYCVQNWANWNDFTAVGGGSTNGYAGGAAFLESDGVTYYYGPQDLNFRTSMTVPEPTSWALMIAGFGLAGSALRRRRTAATAP